MKFQVNEIDKILVYSDTPIKKVIANLNNSRLKIVLVVDQNKKLIGTIVDGDIRRGLLDGLNLNDRSEKIVNRDPLLDNKNVSTFEGIETMKVNNFGHLPIVDENSNLIGLHVLENVRRNKKRDNKVVIMAGGLGKRLRPLSNKKPKALIKVFGKPMLEHVILSIKKSGFKNFYLSINHLGKMIKDYFLDGKKFGVSIKYIEEKNFLGTAGSLSYLNDLKNQTIMVTNCDVISEIDYGDAIDYHKNNNADATMIVNRHEIQNPFGVVETKENKFVSYTEKPIKYENISAGIYIFEAENFKYLKPETYEDMPQFFTNLVKKNKKVIVYPIFEKWNDLGHKKDLLNVE